MTSFYKVLIALIFCIFLIGPSFPQGIDSKSNIKRVVMFGNSITSQGKWDETLGRNDVVSWGIPGYTTGQLIWTIKNVIQEYPATKIWYIEGGINDISLGIPNGRVLQNQLLIIDSLQRNGIVPVIQSTILKYGDNQANKQVIKLNKKLLKYCQKKQIEYIDLNAFLSKDGELRRELSADGCHLNSDGYKPWIKVVQESLIKNGL